MDNFEYNSTNKEFQKIFKLFMSSLFARRQRYLYISKEFPNKCIFSSIPPEKIMVDVLNCEDVIHDVEILGYDIFKLLEVYVPFDLLTGTVFCINTLELRERIRECNDDKKEITKSLSCTDEKNILYLIKNRKVNKEDTDVIFNVVYALTTCEFEYLNDIIKNTLSWIDSGIRTEISLSKDIIINNTVIPFITHEVKNKKLNIPLVEGFNTISIKEYWNKIKNNSSLNCIVGKTDNIIRIMYIYEDSFIRVKSYHPVMYFFVF